MELNFDFQPYIRKPFKVEAVEVTTENIGEMAKQIGRLKYKQDHTPYIDVDNKKVPGIPVAYLGFFLTRFGENLRLFSPNTFAKQFCVADPDVVQWTDWLNSLNSDDESKDATEAKAEEVPQPEATEPVS